MENFQRSGSVSNAQVGKEFEKKAYRYFLSQGIELIENFALPIGVAKEKKPHSFDLGSESAGIIVECKSHKWTSGDNTPSAKITVWNEAMYYFHLAPTGYRKIFFILRDFNAKKNETLGEYYLRTHGHLIPNDVTFVEFDEETNSGKTMNSV
jgi:hypothetical protein